MGKTTGFLEYARKDGPVREESERVNDFCEFHGELDMAERRRQAARCMDCGVPFCQAGASLSGMTTGCPLHNLIPEINDLVYRGRMAEAYTRLSVTHSFPEFTGRVCPALCEAACTAGLHDAAVTTKENERSVIEYAFENGLVNEVKPSVRTGKKVAVIGSGPAGLAAAKALNSRGHEVTVYEKNDRVGGLLRYGIPNMKLDKSVIDRRVKLLTEAGVIFRTGTNVGKDVDAKKIVAENDAVILACGAGKPRDIKVPGRDAKNIFFAVDFLKAVTKSVIYEENEGVNPSDLVKGKSVRVIGGGDTGNDCVGSCIRLGATAVTQLEMMPKPAQVRLPSNPWPEWPRVLKTDYGQEEAAFMFGSDPRVYTTTVSEFKKDPKGNVAEAVLVSLKPEKDEKTGRTSMVPVKGSERSVPADLVLIAAGFLGSEEYIAKSFGVETDARGNIKTSGSYATTDPKIYAAGDARRGQSLVVWAISEGRSVAREVDEALMGYTNL